MKVYTLTGDKGTTSLVGGERVSKDHIRVEAYGAVDELSSHIGMLTAHPDTDADTLKLLQVVQNKLFNLGAYLATNVQEVGPITGLTDDDVTVIERAIDAMDATLPPIRCFVLPRGSATGAIAHVCRAVARRAERRTISLSAEHKVNPLAVKYLNRLSDYFFVLARFNNHRNQISDIFWDKDA